MGERLKSSVETTGPGKSTTSIIFIKGMKKLFFLFLISFAATSYAQHPHRHYYHNHGNNWVVPVIIGGIVGYVIARENQRVIIIRETQVIPQNSLPNNAVVIDGQVYIRQMMPIDGIYREVLIRQ